MARVIWRREALDDLDAIRDYIGQFDTAASDRYALRLIELGDSLAEFPNRGRLAADGRRELAVISPYDLRYDVQDDRATVVEVRHGARLPRRS